MRSKSCACAAALMYDQKFEREKVLKPEKRLLWYVCMQN